MATINKIDLKCSVVSVLMVSISVASFAIFPLSVSFASEPARSEDAALEMQTLVMEIADGYIASLGESVYLLTRSGNLDSKGRWLAQSFLRNGVGASLDIAVGPNPPVSILDLLVLTSLQTWSFEAHWIPAGIGEAGISASERLKDAEKQAWASARKVLSKEQLLTLRGLIDAWIKENSDRTVVSLVRFHEFDDERRISSTSLRLKARGLLKEVSEAKAAVDEVRLLGERLLWLAARYPYLLGEQTELTAYRLIDQPEGAQLIEAINSLQRLSESLTNSIGTLQSDLENQQAAFFTKIASEREAAINQLQNMLTANVKLALDGASESISTQRTQAIDQLFNRLAQERRLLFDDLASREQEMLGLMKELKETISVSGTLAKELTGTVNAIDRVVSRFDTEPGSNREPLRMADVRDAAIATGHAAERMTRTLEQAIKLIEHNAWDKRIRTMTDPAEAIVDRVFWRSVVLIVLLIVGFGLLRLLPRRSSRQHNLKSSE